MATLEASLALRDKFTAVLKSIDRGLTQTTQTMENFKQKVAGPAQALNKLGTMAQAAISKLNSSIRSGMSSAANVVKSLTERILSLFGNFGNRIASKLNLSGVASKFTSAFSGIRGKISSVFSGISSTVGSAFSAVTSKAKSFGSSISSAFSSALNAAKSFGSRMGSFFNGVKNSFRTFGSDLRNGFAGIGESTQKATSGVKNFVAALGLMKIAGVAINVVKDSIGGAIDRFDTLNQFPRMMQAVGFSAEQAAASKDKLVAGIDGLPTTLGEVVSTTQRIATMTKDLDGATSTTLALNNALLASGADTDKIARGTEQYLKILTTGKVEMDSFTTLQETMGVALNDVANSFGFAGDSAQNDLYKALQSGDIPVKDFNNRLIEMSEATGGFAERALIGSEGIKTSFKNIRTAVTNGVETSIRKMDELSQSMTGKSIAQHLNGFKGVVKDVFASLNSQFDKIPGLIQKITPYFNVLKEAFNDIKGPISEAFGAVKDSLAELTGSFGSEKSVGGFKDFVSGITDAIKGLANFVRDNSDSIAKVISWLPKLAAAFVGFKIGKGILSPLLTFGKGLSTIIGATGKLGGNLGKAFGGLFSFGKGKSAAGDPEQTFAPVTSMTNFLTKFAKRAANLALVFAVIKLVEEAAQALKDINDKVPGDLAGLAPKLANMGIAIAGMGAFVAIAGKLAQKNPITALAGLASVAAISLELMLAAEAMQQVNAKVPDDIGSFASKVANIAIAIGGMSVLVGAVGAFVSTGVGAIVGAAGLLAVAAVAGELMLVSEAIQQMDEKVPDDLSSVKSKIDNIAQVIGYFTNANLGNLIDAFEGVVGILNTAVVSAGLKKFEDLAAGFDSFMQIEIPAGIETKISDIQKVLGAFGKTSFEQLLTDLISTADLMIVDEAIDEMISIANALKKLEAIKFNIGKIEESVSKIKEAISFLSEGDSLFSKIANIFGNGLDAGVFATANMAFNELVGVGNSLTNLEGVTFNFKTVERIVKDISNIISALGNANLLDLFGKILKTAELSEIKDTLTAMTELEEPLNSLQAMTVNPTNTIVRVQSIQDILQALDGGDIRTVISTMLKKAELTEVKDALTAMVELQGPLDSIQAMTINPANTIVRIQNLQSIIEALGGAGLKEWLGMMVKGWEIGEVGDTLLALVELQGPLDSLQAMEVNPTNTIIRIQNLQSIIEAMGTGSLGTVITQMIKQEELSQVSETISQLTLVVEAFNSFAANPIDVGAITTAISNVKSVITQLSEFPEITGITGLETLVSTFSSLSQQLSTFVSAAEISVGGLANVSAAFETSMSTMQTSTDSTMVAIQSSATSGMAGFNTAIAAGVALAASTAASGKAQIIAAFNGMGPQLYTVGVFAMSGLARGINAGAASAISAAQSVANRVTSTIQNALKIASPSRVMIAVGRFVSQGLAKGITSAENLVANASNSLATLAIPNQLATVSATGTVTSNVHLDDSEVSKMQASASQTVIVQHKQVVPQVTIHVENNGGEPIDTDALLQEFEDKIVELIDSDLG